MKAVLDTATTDTPVLLGVYWNNGGSPGGGHAIMCVGKGKIPGWNGNQTGYIIEDPYGTHVNPGLLDYPGGGYYWVGDTASNTAHEAFVAVDAGCISGKKQPREANKMANYKKVGVQVM